MERSERFLMALQDKSDWCAEHKREKPCAVCKIAKEAYQKLRDNPDLMRSVWPDDS